MGKVNVDIEENLCDASDILSSTILVNAAFVVDSSRKQICDSAEAV
jgi:hypothetical protein